MYLCMPQKIDAKKKIKALIRFFPPYFESVTERLLFSPFHFSLSLCFHLYVGTQLEKGEE